MALKSRLLLIVLPVCMTGCEVFEDPAFWDGMGSAIGQLGGASPTPQASTSSYVDNYQPPVTNFNPYSKSGYSPTPTPTPTPTFQPAPTYQPTPSYSPAASGQTGSGGGGYVGGYVGGAPPPEPAPVRAQAGSTSISSGPLNLFVRSVANDNDRVLGMNTGPTDIEFTFEYYDTDGTIKEHTDTLNAATSDKIMFEADAPIRLIRVTTSKIVGP